MRDSGQQPPFPSRPTITAPFAGAMLFWVACAIAYSTGDVREPSLSVQLACASLAGTVLAVPMAFWRRGRMVAVMLAAVLAGTALGCSQAAAIHAASTAFEGVAGADAELTLLEDSRDFGFGETALVEGRIGAGPAAAFSARLGNGGPFLTGEHVKAVFTFEPIDYSTDSYAWSDGSCGQLKASDVEVVPAPFPLDMLLAFRKRAIEGIGGDDDAHALLQALVCGYRRNVTGSDMYARFQACGLAHLVAVSGAHMVIVSGLAAAALKRARAPRALAIAVLVVVMGSYFIVAGMPVSALRAMAMSSLGLAAFFGKRRASSLNAIGIATFVIVASSPSSCVSASFTLSALSTAGIVLFGPLFQAWVGRTPLGRLAFVSDALSLTLSASLLSQLYACSLFHQLPIVAPLANVVAGPLFPLVCGAGLGVGVANASAFAGQAPLDAAAAMLSSALDAVVSLLASLPYSSVPFTLDTRLALVISAGCALLLWALWPRPNWRSLAACMVPTLAIAFALTFEDGRDDAIIALDVGQGDAILVQSRGQRYLVDTGNQDSKLLEELARNHVFHLDGVVISHADDDHCGSIDALERAVTVERFVLAADMLECQGDSARSLVSEARECAPQVVGVEAGDVFRIGAFTARVVWPHEFAEDGGNADSLCLLLDYDGNGDGQVDFKALLTGDAEKDELAEMISSGAVGDVDILKVGHHGSRNGSTPEQMAALDPEIALISCGAHNRYGHPTQEILDQLAFVGAETLRTDQNGEIRCTLTPERVFVSRIE